MSGFMINPYRFAAGDGGGGGGAIEFVASDLVKTDDTGGSITTNRPANTQEDDVLLVFIGSEGTSAGLVATPPSGFTKVHEIVTTTENIMFQVFRKVLGASEPSTYDWTLETSSGSLNIIASTLAYRNVDTSNPINADATVFDSDASNECPAPSVSPTATDCMLVCGYIIYRDGTASPASGMTERTQDSVSIEFTVFHADELLSASGATGTRTATFSTFDRGKYSTIALKPA